MGNNYQPSILMYALPVGGLYLTAQKLHNSGAFWNVAVMEADDDMVADVSQAVQGAVAQNPIEQC